MPRFAEVKQLLLRRDLKAALDILKELSIAYQYDSLLNRIEEIEQTYFYLLSYLLKGVDDPERSKMTVGLIAQAFEIAHQLEDQINQREATNYYHISVRNGQNVLQKPLAALVRQFTELSDQELFHKVDKSNTNAENKLLQLHYQKEQLQIELFQKAWLSPLWSTADYEEWYQLFADRTVGDSTELLAVSGLTMALWRRFDPKKLTLLLSLYPQSPIALRSRVLIGIILTLYNHRELLTFYPALRRHFELIAEEPFFKTEAAFVLKEMMRMQETDRVTRKMQEEIIPEMMKLTPKILKKIRPNELDDLKKEDMNPEWNDLMEDKKVTEKMEELGKLQMEGADIYMSTFASMKMYPFFNQIANWFLPFDAEHTVFRYGVSSDAQGILAVTKLVAMSFMLCDSDKYSLSLTMMQMPSFQKEALIGQLKMEQSAEVAEMMTAEAGNQKIDSFIRLYLRDLYRFFKLYPNKASFQESFHMPESVLSVDWLNIIWEDPSLVGELARFNFEKEFYAEAGELYQHLKKFYPTDPKIYQKCGYALQILGRDNEALVEYEEADTLRPSDYWTVRRLAFVYKKLKQNDRALEYFVLADKLKPDHASIAMHIGHLYLEQKNYTDALKYYFKAEYLDPENIRTWRPIAWCSFLTHKFAQAERYYHLIIEDQPTPDDYVNAGHTALALGKNTEALRWYKQALAKGMDWNEWCEMLDHDREELMGAAIKPELIDALPDLVLYNWE